MAAKGTKAAAQVGVHTSGMVVASTSAYGQPDTFTRVLFDTGNNEVNIDGVNGSGVSEDEIEGRVAGNDKRPVTGHDADTLVSNGP